MNNPLIPNQEIGSKLDVVAHIELDSEAEALAFFQLVKQRLLDVNHWDEICQLPSAAFKLISVKNQEIVGLVKEKDFIRINVPGPGSKQGEGFDWVQVEQITDTLQILSITVRPSKHPLKPAGATAHFFRPSATSTFQVKHIGNKIFAEVHGRNELPNNKEGLLIDKIRNTMVGLGAKLGFSYPQWKLLVEGLVRR